MLGPDSHLRLDTPLGGALVFPIPLWGIWLLTQHHLSPTSVAVGSIPVPRPLKALLKGCGEALYHSWAAPLGEAGLRGGCL